jgi:hypothetical protein
MSMTQIDKAHLTFSVDPAQDAPTTGGAGSPDTAAKDATISVTLRADNGYLNTKNARVRASQYHRICAILAEA